MELGGLPFAQSFPGVPPLKVVAISEKIQSIHTEGLPYCFKRCTTHFTDDALPYLAGERTCFDRCISKLYEEQKMAREIRDELELKFRTGQSVAPWMEELQRGRLKSTQAPVEGNNRH